MNDNNNKDTTSNNNNENEKRLHRRRERTETAEESSSSLMAASLPTPDLQRNGRLPVQPGAQRVPGTMASTTSINNSITSTIITTTEPETTIQAVLVEEDDDDETTQKSQELETREANINQNHDSIVSANVVDEQELEAEYRDRILGDIFDASEILPLQESEPPTFWERHKISVVLCILMTTVLVLVLLLTLTEAPSAETQVQDNVSEETPTFPPTLPPTLQGIHERGYIRCRVSDREVDVGKGYSIDLVSTI
jgi:hypothetical protein